MTLTVEVVNLWDEDHSKYIDYTVVRHYTSGCTASSFVVTYLALTETAWTRSDIKKLDGFTSFDHRRSRM